MAGISNKALKGQFYPNNNKKYNGIEFNEDFDLDQYDAYFRTLDPQIGRWAQIDPKANNLKYLSPYLAVDNNPILNVDPLGDFRTRFGAWIYSFFNGGGIVHRNEFGEYYLAKTSFSKDVDGVFNLTSSIYYGEGRNKYSSAGEDFEDLQSKAQLKEEWTRLGIWDPNISPENAGENALNLGTAMVIPSVYIRPTTNLFNIPKPKLTSAQMGKLIGWGETQASEQVKVTRELIDNLTKAQVKNWAKNGLTKAWVTDQLVKYNRSILVGGKKLKNVQLLVRKELMEKILELWK